MAADGLFSRDEVQCGLPAPAWMAVLFLIGLYYISRETLSSRAASALVVGAIILSAILITSLRALTQVPPEYRFWPNVPLVSGRPFEPGALELILGVILAAYYAGGRPPWSTAGRARRSRPPVMSPIARPDTPRPDRAVARQAQGPRLALEAW